MNIGIDASSRTCLPYYFYFVWFSAWKNVQISMWNNVETTLTWFTLKVFNPVIELIFSCRLSLFVCFELIYLLICRFILYWFIYSLHWFFFHCFSFWVLVLLASLLFHFCFHQLFSWPCVSFFLPHQHLIGFVCFSFSKIFFKFRWIVSSIFIILRFLRYYDFDEFHKMCSNISWCLFVIVHQLITISSD